MTKSARTKYKEKRGVRDFAQSIPSLQKEKTSLTEAF